MSYFCTKILIIHMRHHDPITIKIRPLLLKFISDVSCIYLIKLSFMFTCSMIFECVNSLYDIMCTINKLVNGHRVLQMFHISQ